MSHALPFLTNSKVREIVRPLKQPTLIVRWLAIRGFVTKVKAVRTARFSVDPDHNELDRKSVV